MVGQKGRSHPPEDLHSQLGEHKQVWSHSLNTAGEGPGWGLVTILSQINHKCPQMICTLHICNWGGKTILPFLWVRAQSCPTLATPWTIACQSPLSKEFSRQENWSGLPFPSPGDLPDPGIEPVSLAFPVWQVGSLPLSHLGRPNHSPNRYKTRFWNFPDGPVIKNLPFNAGSVGWIWLGN